MDLLRTKRVYMIGVKGAGMTALAELLVKSGVEVSGSDTEEIFFTDAILERLKITVKTPFQAENIDSEADLFIYSTAYTSENNEEFRAAQATRKPMLSYPEALGKLTEQKLTLAVCGTHGKTTTSALLAEALDKAEMKPSAIVGSEIKSWQGGTLAGTGQYLVIEADEYQDKLRHYTPFGIVLTSVDWDHPDFFSTVEEYEAIFERFLTRLPRHGFLVACGDDARVRAIAKACTAETLFYGFLEENDVRVVDWEIIDPESIEGKRGLRQRFRITYHKESFGSFALTLSGKHNAANTAAVISAFLRLKIPLDTLATTFENFCGTKRRFELIGERNGALVFDDYAHHPEEIRVTLQAFRELYPKRTLTVIFHPHTYTRTKALLPEFAEALSLADRVILIDIYGSAREAHGGVSSNDVVERINQVWPEKAIYQPERDTIVSEWRTKASSTDLIVTMGAGDVWQIAEALVNKNQ